MKLQLEKSIINLIEFNLTNDLESGSLSLRFGNSYDFEDKHTFTVNFELIMPHNQFYLKVESSHFFKASDEITEEFKESRYPIVSAPAIAFPFLRAFVSTLTLQIGIEPLIMPSINFMETSNRIIQK